VALLNHTLLDRTLQNETMLNQTYSTYSIFHNLTISEVKLLLAAVNWTQGFNWSYPHHSRPLRRPCMAGFAIQGQLDPGRRNYSGIWHDMGQKLKGPGGPHLQRDARFAITIMGSGFVWALRVPRYLWPYVRLHLNLRFEHYYNVIYHNVALVPSLAGAAYYNKKFSSTIVTSLITTTPIIADERLLTAYKFLDESCVFYQQAGEGQLDVVTRVLSMTYEEVVRRRFCLKRLRARLNYRATLQMKWWVMQGQAHQDEDSLGRVDAQQGTSTGTTSSGGSTLDPASSSSFSSAPSAQESSPPQQIFR